MGSAVGESRSRIESVLQEFEVAIEKRRVSLDQVMEAHRMSLRRHVQDDEIRSAYADVLPRLLRAYEKRNGRIEDAYFCKRIEGTAVLTERVERKRWQLREQRTMRNHIRYPPAVMVDVAPEFEETLWRCIALSKRATQLLHSENSRLIHKLMHSLVVYLLSVLDTTHDAADVRDRNRRIAGALERADKELAGAERQYVLAAVWGAQSAYSRGMLGGMLILAAVLGIALAFATRVNSVELYTVLVSLAAGGIGAMVSVMSRLSSESFNINYLAEHKSLGMRGIFRPMIGAIFGAAVYVLVAGGLVSTVFQKEQPPLRSLYFFAGLAFLAGFSERFAKDAVTHAADVLPSGTPLGAAAQAPGPQMPPAGVDGGHRARDLD